MKKCRMLFLSLCVPFFVGCTTEPVREAPSIPRSAKLPEPHLIPNTVYVGISSIIESGSSRIDQVEKVRSSLCTGVSPRLSIKRTFTYRPPTTTGLAIDEALQWRTLHSKGARHFLKNEFFYYSGQSYRGVSQPENLEEPLAVDQLDNVDREAYELRNFVNGPSLLLKTYAARFLKPLYFHEGGYADMQFLFQKFTFRVPLEVVIKFEQINPTPNIKLPAANHYFGYDRDIFSPKLAMDHQDFIWRWIAKNSTSIAEAATENGDIRFVTEMNLEFFCKYSVPVTELRSR
ncbi:MAG: hypothetical protein IPL83_02470 [Bdellovibrionales bacterium]|nr:hypothetical protein [Bdellovibrionales bacterium]